MRGNRMWIALSIPVMLYAAMLIGFPMVQMVVASFQGETPFSNYAYFIQSSAYRTALISTLALSAAVVVVVVLSAAILAWYLVFSRSRILKILIITSVMTPFMMGVVIKNYSLALIFNQGGVLSRIWENVPVVGGPVDLMYTPTAVVVGIAYSVLPFGFIPLVLVISSLDTNIVDAAHMLGASKLRAFWDVIVPQCAPGILASAAVVFMMSIGYYVTPVMLGGASSPFLASLIHRQIFQQFNSEAASASGVILVLSASLVMVGTVAVVGVNRLKRYV